MAVLSGTMREVMDLPPKQRILLLLKEKAARRKLIRLAYYRPYPTQAEFHAQGANFRERLLMAPNQVGKTLAAGMEVAMHVTGRYPEGWEGKRFGAPTNGWVAGVTGESTRDNPQRILLGRGNEIGTGAIPRECIESVTPARGIAGLADIIRVKHVSGGISLIGLKSYEKGREKWQGDTLDWIWFDEEPPEDIYFEGLTRTNVTQGPVFVTFTPLKGMSKVVKRFLVEKKPGTVMVHMDITDAMHYTDEEREAIIASYPEHEREARAHGHPAMGSGVIFPVDWDTILVPAMPIPGYWPQIAGIDFGYDHPTASTHLAIDPDSDCIYVTNEYRVKKKDVVYHAAALKVWGDWLPFAWPQDGLQHDKGSGEQLAEQYRKQGLKMLHEHARFELSGTEGERPQSRVSVEAGLSEILTRMQTNRWKVFDHLEGWKEEARMYRREDGKIVKEDEDLICSSRYAMMMARYAVTHQSVTQQVRPARAVNRNWRVV